MISVARPLRLLLVALALAGCGKGKAPVHGGAAAGGIDNVTVSAPAGRVLADDLAAMPKETEMVIGVDFVQLRNSAVLDPYEAMLRDSAATQLAELESKCGFDPWAKVTGVLVGLNLPLGGGPPRDARSSSTASAADAHQPASWRLLSEPRGWPPSTRRLLRLTGTSVIRALFVDDDDAVHQAGCASPTRRAHRCVVLKGRRGSPVRRRSSSCSPRSTQASMFICQRQRPALTQSRCRTRSGDLVRSRHDDVHGELHVRMENEDAAHAIVALRDGRQEMKKMLPAGSSTASTCRRRLTPSRPPATAAQLDEIVTMVRVL
jgi:hypothetical protein